MRLGASISFLSDDPEEMARSYVEAGYGAAICPDARLDQPERINAISQAFARQDVRLAEIGVWNNMLDPDPQRRKVNLEANIARLALGDEIGVGCCVNIAGSFNPERWDGPHPKNISEEAYELTIDNVRQILDAVKPKRTYYTLEPMPWVIPDSPESYLRLIRAVDRPMFAVHLDPVNMINCPQRYYQNADFLRECFEKLGKWIVSCHGKDSLLRNELTVNLQEVRPGMGHLDYGVFLRELNRLPGDLPLILEHLPAEDYSAARGYVVSVAEQNGLSFTKPKGSA